MRSALCLVLVALFFFSGCTNRQDVGSAPESAAETAESVSQAAPPVTVRLTVPEGYTLPRIGMQLAEMGICTAEEFVEASLLGDYSQFPLLAQQEENPNRCFPLEGYLFPDTYEVYSDESPGDIIRRMLRNTEGKIDEGLRYRIGESGYTVDEILTIASIIEKEAFGPREMPMISSVLHNRLETGMKLQCDVTISYVRNVINHFAQEPQRFEAHYDAYQCPALPAGAICNPSLAAIEAALGPAESEFFFFVTDNAQNYYYGKTWEEHQANIQTAKAVNLQLEGQSASS